VVNVTRFVQGMDDMIASRALMAKFSSAFSICAGSMKVFHKPPRTIVSIRLRPNP
jgi:hypothetical protein